MLALRDVAVRVGAVDILDGVTLLRPSQGEVTWQGEAPADPVRWRRRIAGFVFQEFCLVPELSALENVLLPLRFERFGAGALRGRAVTLLAEMGIAVPGRRAALMSRGEQQRVAIARAMLRTPAVILADEPTASLDAASGALVAGLLVAAAREAGAALLVVSHDPALLDRVDEVHRLQAGRLV